MENKNFSKSNYENKEDYSNIRLTLDEEIEEAFLMSDLGVNNTNLLIDEYLFSERFVSKYINSHKR